MENEDLKNQNNKSNKGLIILVIILIIALISTGCYMILTPPKVKKLTPSPTPEEKTNTGETIAPDSEEVTNLITNLTTAIDTCGIYNYFTDQEITTFDIDNSLAFQLAITVLYKEKQAQNITNLFTADDTFTEEEITTEVQNLFGTSYQFTHQNYPNTCPKFNFNKDTNQYYVPNTPICGLTCGPTNVFKITEATKYDDSLVIDLKMLFVDTEKGNGIEYYKDYTKTKLITSISEDDFYMNHTVDISDEDYMKGDTYRLTFTLENDHYVFTSSKLLK